MEPSEVEFLGEKQLVSIIPTFNKGIIHLISGDVGPFRASIPVKVPLWLALYLKEQQKCKIQQPDWMDIEKLEALKENEKNSRGFIPMPSEHFMIEAKLLLKAAADDIPRTDEIRTIIKDIWDIRLSKIRSSIDIMVKNTDSYAAIDHFTLMEINSVRPILPHTLEQIYRMKKSQKIDLFHTPGNSTFLDDSRLLQSP